MSLDCLTKPLCRFFFGHSSHEHDVENPSLRKRVGSELAEPASKSQKREIDSIDNIEDFLLSYGSFLEQIFNVMPIKQLKAVLHPLLVTNKFFNTWLKGEFYFLPKIRDGAFPLASAAYSSKILITELINNTLFLRGADCLERIYIDFIFKGADITLPKNLKYLRSGGIYTDFDLTSATGLDRIEVGTVYGNSVLKLSENLQSLKVDDVEGIVQGEDCKKLREVEIGDIERNGFVKLPESVRHLTTGKIYGIIDIRDLRVEVKNAFNPEVMAGGQVLR